MTVRRLQIAAFFSHTLLLQAITFILRPTATYRAIELGVPVRWLGVIAASFAIVPLLLAIPSGQVADRFGERRLVLAGGVLVVLSAAAFVLGATTVLGIVGASVLLGSGHLCCVIAQQSMISNRTPSGRLDTVFGHHTFVAAGGQAVGPLLILVLGGDRPIPETDDIFIWAAALSGVLLVLGFAAPRRTAPGGIQETASGSIGALLRMPGLLRALTVSCVVLAAIDITIVYLPALGSERGISSGSIGVLLSIRAAASMASRLFLGTLVKRMGRNRLLVIGIAMASAGLAATAVPMPVELLAVVIALVGLGLGAGQPLTMSWLAETTPPGMRGRAVSLRLMGNRLGQVVVPSAAGFLAIGTGAAGVLVGIAAGLAWVGVAAQRAGK